MTPKKKPLFGIIIFILTISFMAVGCVRLWGGATCTKEKPREMVQKTYILGNEFTSPYVPKDNTESGQ